jgi:phosphosulfolactate phosphohydrolase-like enzyme
MERVATRKFVRTDALPDSVWRCAGYDAIVCVDVLLSATTIVTAVSQGRHVFAAPNPAHARWLKSRLPDALVLGDTADAREESISLGGPSLLNAACGTACPLVLVSPLAEMIASAPPEASVYVACLRNLDATARTIARRHSRVAILAAGEGGEVCAADEMVASWLAERLRRLGFELEGRSTSAEVERWGRAGAALVGWSRAAERLRACGQAKDVDFVLEHLDDLEVVCVGGELPGPMSHQQGHGARPKHAPHTPKPALGIQA